MADEKNLRIAIVDPDKCQPKKCAQECKKNCPVVMMGKLCIQVTKTDSIANISEMLCNGCGICTRKCPFKAVKIVNLPKPLGNITHRYGTNGFILNGLPVPRKGCVLGILGANGTGKSTAVKILAKKLVPNFGGTESKKFKGTELQTYFGTDHKVAFKPQYVEMISTIYGEKKVSDLGKFPEYDLPDREVKLLSGGELQKLAIALTLQKDATVYIFDEPSSFLDVDQRVKMARLIRKAAESKYVIVIEHDLSILDYVSDYIQIIYGEPGAYGIVSMPMNNAEGINAFLSGYLAAENMRFRSWGLSFTWPSEDRLDVKGEFKYPDLDKKYDGFQLDVKAGTMRSSSIVVMMGRNGMGKTTMIRLLMETQKISVSYKPQKIAPKFTGTVQELFYKQIPSAMSDSLFTHDVIKTMNIERLYDNKVLELSGGELQRVAIALCLGKPADIYMLDEPSAFLDVEQRIQAAKAIKRFIISRGVKAFIVEHDFLMSLYLADQIIVFSGDAGKSSVAHPPMDVPVGLNMFLEELGITFRQDTTSKRPRINMLDSQKDKEQKGAKQYYYSAIVENDKIDSKTQK